MLDDFLLWNEYFTGNYTASRNGCYRVPIPEIIIPGIPTQVVLIGCFSTSAYDSWNTAGYLNQIIQLPFKPAYHQSVKCLLGKNNLIILPNLNTGFTLSFKPVRWLDDLQLKVSNYTGEYP